MADYADKWNKLAQAYQKAIKGEALWSRDIQRVNTELKKICTELDQIGVEVTQSVFENQGYKKEDAPAYAAKFTSRMRILKGGGHVQTVRNELANTDKATQPKTYRALKVLASGIEEIATMAEYMEKDITQKVADIGQEISSQERVARVQAKALLQVKKAVKKSLAWAQKVKSDPTPRAWTDAMNGGMTRDVIMGIVALEGAQKKGDFGTVPAASAHKAVMSSWNTGQRDSAVNDDALPAAVKAKLKTWVGLVKACEGDYSPHW
jgi:hypothetical protein